MRGIDFEPLAHTEKPKTQKLLGRMCEWLRSTAKNLLWADEENPGTEIGWDRLPACVKEKFPSPDERPQIRDGYLFGQLEQIRVFESTKPNDGNIRTYVATAELHLHFNRKFLSGEERNAFEKLLGRAMPTSGFAGQDDVIIEFDVNTETEQLLRQRERRIRVDTKKIMGNIDEEKTYTSVDEHDVPVQSIVDAIQQDPAVTNPDVQTASIEQVEQVHVSSANGDRYSYLAGILQVEPPLEVVHDCKEYEGRYLHTQGYVPFYIDEQGQVHIHLTGVSSDEELKYYVQSAEGGKTTHKPLRLYGSSDTSGLPHLSETTPPDEKPVRLFDSNGSDE